MPICCKRSAKTCAIVMCVLLVTGCATIQRGHESRGTLKTAEQAIQHATATGHVWRLVDAATGTKSVDLDTLLDAARAAHRERDYDDAIRIAERVIDAARLGIRQARAQRNAAPYYPDP
ncbi:MAG: hypothetical protein OEQ39_22360 [Gammaproteobacteria bacterium]|nr:hypothetical protein [Gammaproteobacteria bacterium]MDH3466174.1 hypothetical protein [Gammaproteobacteria bacterium]